MSEIITALATPFIGGKVDVESFGKLVESQAKCNIDGLLVAGATGEGMLLSPCEKKLLVTIAKQVAKNTRIWLNIDGVGTREAISEVQWANKLGVDGLMISPPAFCKCTSVGLLEHVKKLVHETTLPIMLYNAPSRVGYVLPLDVVQMLSHLGVTVKDAGKDLTYTKSLQRFTTVYCGNEQRATDFCTLGIDKAVSVVANVCPQLTKDFFDGALTKKQMAYFRRIARLTMVEVNPVAVKYILYKLGVFHSAELRLPLTEASARTKGMIDEVFA
ncbi:MAG: dihydrodipicolinate synthase family protein [Clostridia bacterium]|nr:dihydrodipicolinate synthase family protein [Clostridia bacterium]